MTQIKTKTTVRKFYNKWLYKISFIHHSLLHVIRYDYKDLKDNPDSCDFVRSLSKILSNQAQGTFNRRIESKILDIYTNDIKLFDELKDRFAHKIRYCSAPLIEQQDLDSQNHLILSSKLPFDRYNFKVFLKPHKITDKQEKLKWLKWVDGQKPRVAITDKVKDWFYRTEWNWDRRYLYVEDESSLLMLKLRNPEVLGTVYTYKIIDK
jgi:hypothetical protein